MIFDCFTYFNDDLITELRLNILDKYVDKFVIVEATTDHSGKKKDFNYNIKKFEKFEKKIRYIIVDEIQKNTKPINYNIPLIVFTIFEFTKFNQRFNRKHVRIYFS